MACGGETFILKIPWTVSVHIHDLCNRQRRRVGPWGSWLAE